MAFYFIRHGETSNNVKNLFTGRTNPSLTKRGEEQARQAAAVIKDLDITWIVSSPLDRAEKTAEIITESIGYGGSVEIDERIIEYNLGELEGTKLRKVSEEEFSKIEGIEPPADFRDRLIDFLIEHKDKDGNILIVSHAGVYRMIESARLGLDPGLFHTVDRPDNASYIELDLDWLDK